MRIRKFLQKTEENPKTVQTETSALSLGFLLVLTSVILICFGLIALYSTSFYNNHLYYFIRQLIYMGIGTFSFFAVVLAGYKFLCKWSMAGMIFVSILLVLALFSPVINGARRWVYIGSFSFQPSEFAKVCLVLFMSRFFSEYASDWQGSAKKQILCMARNLFIPCGIVIGLVLQGKDLGTTVLLASLVQVFMIIADVKWYFIYPPGQISLQQIYLGVRLFSSVRMGRITSFLDPEKVKASTGYQLWRSLLALGSGGWTGLGFTESRLKLSYLPEAHTDFILAIVGEELGFVSLIAVIVAYLVLLFAGLGISCKTRHLSEGMFVSFGMISFITIQAIINMGVICGAFPTKGMPAPMISFGGTNLVACMAAIGCVFSVALDMEYPDYNIVVWEKFKSLFHIKSECRKEL